VKPPALPEAKLTGPSVTGYRDLVHAKDLAKVDPGLGDKFNVDKQGFTRCATTACAIATYFCGAVASSLIYAGPQDLTHSGVAGLRRLVHDIRSRGRARGVTPQVSSWLWPDTTRCPC
jgi:hypothetical protein